MLIIHPHHFGVHETGYLFLWESSTIFAKVYIVSDSDDLNLLVSRQGIDKVQARLIAFCQSIGLLIRT
jgi:hypothetical protein